MSPKTIEVDAVSFARMADALELAGSGELAEAVEHLADAPEGELGPFFQGLRRFLDQVRHNLETKERVLAELQMSRTELEEALATVQRQQLAIQDLGTPIIDVWDDVIALPVIGVIDTQRALMMMQRLLARIEQGRALCVIIDLTGVDVVDSKTAEYLINMTKAASLLGSFCVITGVGADIAQTLVQLGIELGDVKTLRSLKNGLRACFAHLAATSGERSSRRPRRIDTSE